jgi:hypothetical protein
MNVLSIQSQVVYGHVGNSAAAFVLQRRASGLAGADGSVLNHLASRPSAAATCRRSRRAT